MSLHVRYQNWKITDTREVLQVRALAYQDTQRYRLGSNFAQLPINRPKNSFNPLRRDGAGCFLQGQGQNENNFMPYYPSSFYSIDIAPQYAIPSREAWSGRVVDFESKMEGGDLEQPREFWEHILAKEPGQQENLVSNVAESLAEAVVAVREKAFGKYCPLFPNSFPPSSFQSYPASQIWLGDRPARAVISQK